MTASLVRRLSVFAGVALLGAGLAAADTLFLRDGRRVEGELVSVRGDVVEFRERGFFGGGRVKTYDRDDVERIDLERSGRSSEAEEREGGRPSGMRERETTVAANAPWTDTGIDVRYGQPVYFSATGKISWGPGRKDDAGGESGSHSNPNRPMPSHPGAALIGKVGEGRDYFFIGKEEGEFRMRGSGRLYLGVNDDYLQDNTGGFRVTIYY